ncbi:glycoside hydrolase family 65 protein [Paenibacillus sp. MY03]|uniref:glycoside hydrolase family 65 protein n=1 Tax=Paenibacillus sp. MY03 TaxID=302980 RepID=UPI0015C5A2E3|nr:glycoside hydrolase family 65 protein [Paenibacillus sp. MY03]
MKIFDYNNDDFWTVRLRGDEWGESYIPPYTGNGAIGVRFGPLVASVVPGDAPGTVTRYTFDGGEQRYVPDWNRIGLTVGGVSLVPGNGTEGLTQTLDMRTGEAFLEGDWVYKEGRSVQLRIRMIIPRSYEYASILTVEVEGLSEVAKVTFGLDGSNVTGIYAAEYRRSGNRLSGDYRTPNDGNRIVQALAWEMEDLSPVGYETDSESAQLTAFSQGDQFSLRIYHTVRSDYETEDPAIGAAQLLNELTGIGVATIMKSNREEWRRLWSSGLAFTDDDPNRTKLVLAAQFHLLCSLSEQPFPFGTLGVAGNGWGGSQLWDADLWVFRAILPLWPHLAKPIVEYRLSTLENARIHAADNGYRGAWYPWAAKPDGTPNYRPEYREEIHNNVWIALSAWEYANFTDDKDFLVKAWPMIRDIADFFVSRGEWGDDGDFHLCNVLGPNEAVAEFGHRFCDDNHTTNFGATKVWQAADECARRLGKVPNPEWNESAERIYLTNAGLDGIVPEYTGYAGEGIKQADFILSLYPLGLEMGKREAFANISYYHDKIMAYGPLMNAQIESCLFMLYGDKELGLEHLFREFGKYVRGPHFIPFEGRTNNVAYLLTGIGGLLQALLYGYYGNSAKHAKDFPTIGKEGENNG